MQKLIGLSEFMGVEDSDELRPLHPPAEYANGAPPPCASTGKESPYPVYQASMSGGRTVPLLKTALTTACERNCNYCAFRSGRDFRRTTMKPEELAELYMRMFQSGVVKGLFLSSGVAGGGPRTQDRLIATADILRKKYNYQGYLHLKIMPGSERQQVEASMRLADRVSVNLEAPSTEALNRLAPQKVLLEELLTPLRWVEELRAEMPEEHFWNGRRPSSTTQFVVGAVGENDLDLLRATDYLYRKLRLRRAYFSVFRPVQDTPFEEQQPENPWRSYRLYQASFLLRDYGFQYEDFPFAQNGRLPLEQDPKLAWARLNLSETPVEVNRADLQHLLRVPGIGPRGAKAILGARRQGRLTSLEDLMALGIVARRAAPFILLSGQRPVFQLPLL